MMCDKIVLSVFLLVLTLCVLGQPIEAHRKTTKGRRTAAQNNAAADATDLLGDFLSGLAGLAGDSADKGVDSSVSRGRKAAKKDSGDSYMYGCSPLCETGQKAVPKKGFVAHPNGCGVGGMNIDSGYDFEPCCNDHGM
jgi:hypothetical protein